MIRSSFKFLAKCLFVYFYQWKFFADGRQTLILHFHFKNAKCTVNSVIPSLEVGIEATALRTISFRCPCGLLVQNFSRLWANRRASGNWEPIMLQPWIFCYLLMSNKHGAHDMDFFFFTFLNFHSLLMPWFSEWYYSMHFHSVLHISSINNVIITV